MKTERIFPVVAIAFAVVLVGYILAFSLLEGARSKRGGWEVTFETDAAGAPSVSIRQPSLNIENVRLLFQGVAADKTNLSETIRFDEPRTNAPLGRVIFIDTTFLPGTLTMDLYGHEIELIPRTLVVNRQEMGWPSRTNILLGPISTPESFSAEGSESKE